MVYANSVMGARTNKTADYMDICAALIGKVPFTGVHIDEERMPFVVLDGRELFQECAALLDSVQSNNDSFDGVDKRIMSSWDSFYSVLGYVCGILSEGKVPLILLGLERNGRIEHWKYPTLDDLKSFSAAFGTTASSPLFHIAGITPEAREHADIETMINSIHLNDRNWRKIDMEDVRRGYEALSLGCGKENAVTQESLLDDDNEPIKLVALGNPHLSLSECRTLNSLISSGLKKHDNIRVIVTLGRRVRSEADRLGYISTLEKFGVEFINDTCWCMLLDPPIIPLSKKDKILTNSAKYAVSIVDTKERIDVVFVIFSPMTDNFAV